MATRKFTGLMPILARASARTLLPASKTVPFVPPTLSPQDSARPRRGHALRTFEP